jgi:glycosyltransferase involved in cell wall biosynthesis
MAEERKQIAIIYSYNEGWIGGTYYIQNLVQSLTLLDDHLKPNLIILCDSDEEFKQIQVTGYPYLKKWENNKCNFEGDLTLLDRLINKVTRIFTGKNVIQKPAILNYPGKIDAIFPIPPEFRAYKEAKKNIFWIPDFQELNFPQFFDEHQLTLRKSLSEFIAQKSAQVIFSSNDALNDFNRIYPVNNSVKFVVPFAVTHPDFKAVDIQNTFTDFGITTPYFFAPNQFWVHKNQITLIKATQLLLEKKGDLDFMLIFSGKEDDYRNPDYTASLKRYVDENNLSNHIKFLGFIDRKIQLQIMHHALAVVQPSLCEGWSTVIEDAKALNQRIIASDLPVHQEQLQEYTTKLFFKKSVSEDLAEKMQQLLSNPFERKTIDYNVNRKLFASAFLKAINHV